MNAKTSFMITWLLSRLPLSESSSSSTAVSEDKLPLSHEQYEKSVNTTVKLGLFGASLTQTQAKVKVK